MEREQKSGGNWTNKGVRDFTVIARKDRKD